MAEDSLFPSATSTEWIRPAEDAGSWFNPNNWSEGRPNASDVVVIARGGEVLIRRGKANAKTLRMEHVFGDFPLNRVIQSGGNLNIDEELAIYDGQYELQRGLLSTQDLKLGRGFELCACPAIPVDPNQLFIEPWDGIGTVPGKPSIPTTVRTHLLSSTLEGVDTDIPILFYRFPTQQFHQTGGRLRVGNRLSVHGGGVRISGGTFATDSLLIDASPRFVLDTDGLVPALAMEQEGGYVDIRDSLLIQNGRYELSGGILKVDRLAIGDPAMEGEDSWRTNRLPEFVHTGGYAHVEGNLELCVPGFILPERKPFLSANYRMEAGGLRVDGDTIVGSLGTAPVNFFQSGGKVHLGGTLRIEGQASTYNISGGKLYAKQLEIGLGEFNTGGTFSYSAPAKVTVDQRVSLGRESHFEAVPGSKLKFRGDQFENYSDNDENHLGLNNLELTVEGNLWNRFSWWRPRVAEMEVGGVDLGDDPNGYTGNFAIDTLRVGGFAPVQLSLVDLIDNQPDYEGEEALYVDHLFVSRGSKLDTGGLALYYRTATILGQILNAPTISAIASVPEPGCVMLMMSGIVASCCRRSRARSAL